MARILPILLLASSTSFSPAIYADCSEFKTGSSTWMSCVNSQRAKLADENINSLIAALSTKLNNIPDSIKAQSLLEQSQRAWEASLNKQCNLEQYIYGGLGGINYTMCTERLTKERQEYLKALLNNI